MRQTRPIAALLAGALLAAAGLPGCQKAAAPLAGSGSAPETKAANSQAATAAAAKPASPADAAAEAAAVQTALADLCEPYFKPGASKKAEDYAAKVKAAGWVMHEAPGVVVFNIEGGWGQGRAGFQSDFEGATCRITLWQPAGITTPHDDGPTMQVLADWMAKALPGAKMTKEKQKPEAGKGPPEAVDTWWSAPRNIQIMFRSVPPKGHRPILYIDVKREVF
jgi:hypothetical protein